MGKMGEWTYRFVELNSTQLAYVQELVRRGDDIFNEEGTPQSKVLAWVTELRVFVHSIDPLGDDYSGSISCDLYDAKLYGAYVPQNDEEQRATFGNFLGIARSLITGPIKIAASKVSERDRQSNCVFHRRDLKPQENLVFILMPFMESWSDYIWRKEIKPIVESVSESTLICKRADDLYGQDVMVDVYESILTARIIIAEITNRNPNVFYELGLAHALGKDVIILSQGDVHIPFDLKRFRHCIYSNDGPGYEKLRQWLPNAIKETLAR